MTFIISDDFSDCCDHDEMASGCRLERSSQTGSASGMECLCGVGCDREFQFRTLAECEAKLKCMWKCFIPFPFPSQCGPKLWMFPNLGVVMCAIVLPTTPCPWAGFA